VGFDVLALWFQSAPARLYLLFQEVIGQLAFFIPPFVESETEFFPKNSVSMAIPF